MSVQAMAWAFQRDMNPSAKLTLLAVANFADDQGECWPSISTLCRLTSLSEASVHRAIRELIEAGLVVRSERSGRSNVWKLSMGGVTVTPPPDGGVSHRDPGVSERDPGGVTVTPRTVIEPSGEPSTNLAPTNGAVSVEIRSAVKNALASEWTGAATLSPEMWLRVEQATKQILAVGVGPAVERGATLADIPEGLAQVHALWRTTNPGKPFPPQTASREWVRFLNGELEKDAEVAEDHAAWIATVRRRMR